ncbi:hypothetical protein HOH87_02060 [bacterium]|nr:hypothetical protein [bacterium]
MTLGPIEEYKGLDRLDLHHRRPGQQSSQQDSSNHSFLTMLAEEFEETEDVPDQLVSGYDLITSHAPLAYAQLHSISVEFSQVAIHICQQHRQMIHSESEITQQLDRQLSVIMKVLFITVADYGLGDSIQFLVDIWRKLRSDSPVFEEIQSFFKYIGAATLLPLNVYLLNILVHSKLTQAQTLKTKELKQLLKQKVALQLPSYVAAKLGPNFQSSPPYSDR